MIARNGNKGSKQSQALLLKDAFMFCFLFLKPEFNTETQTIRQTLGQAGRQADLQCAD